MNRRKGWLLGLAIVVAATFTAGCGRATEAEAMTTKIPAASAPATPEAAIERGRYLVEHVAHCFQCHAPADYSTPEVLPVRGLEGAGARFDDEGFTWLVVPNITPDEETGAGRWSDEQLARALREGVGHDGRALFGMMPFMFFRSISDGDVAAITAYLRSIPAVRNPLPPSDFPEPIRASLLPLPPLDVPVPEPDRSDPVKYGEYLTQVASCAHCHTPLGPTGEPIPGLDWAGGLHIKGPWGDVHSANLTTDPSGIPYYTEELFFKVMRSGNIGGRHINGIMPWAYFRGMTDEDLRAIFAYLKTLPPVRHHVDNTEKPTPCALCGGVHGLGELNGVVPVDETLAHEASREPSRG